MGWATGNLPDGTPVGYAVLDTCHEDGCAAAIDRGLAYVCGDMHGGGEHGCGGYFCAAHLSFVAHGPGRGQLCARCVASYDDEFSEDERAPADATGEGY